MKLSGCLSKLYKKDNADMTHTRIKNENMKIKGGSYTITGDNLDEFLKCYYTNVIENSEVEYMTERQIQDGPLCIDFDFRYSGTIKNRQHTIEDIVEYIDVLFSELKMLVKIEDESTFDVYVFEKDSVNCLNEEDVTKDGIHMILCLNIQQEMKQILRERFISKIIGKCNLPLKNTWDKVFDEGICKGHTNWQMYGSTKPGNQPYKLTGIFTVKYEEENKDFDMEQLTVPKKVSYDLFKKMSVQNRGHPYLQNTGLGNEEMKNSKQKTKKSKVKLIKDKKKETIDCLEDIDEMVNEFVESLDACEHIVLEAHQYAMILPAEYYESGSYDKWIRLALALHCTDKRLFVTWLKVSSKAKNFKISDVDELREKWDHLSEVNKGELTMKSIRYWAQEDGSMEDYELVRKNTLDHHINASIDPTKPLTEFDSAVVLHFLYRERYLCISVKHNIWMEFKNHRWVEIDSGTTLRLSLSQDVYELYMHKLNELMKNVEIESDELIAKKIKDKIHRLTEVTGNLKRTVWKNNILREAKDLFYDQSFIDNQDKNPYLMCFNNGVYDFKEGVFRNGRYDDYITKSTKNDYVKLEECDSNVVEEIHDFMNKLFPLEDLRNYMYEHLSSCLIGTNENQTFNIYTGSGRNGKSKLVELMSMCLGDYKAIVPITLVTQTRRGIGSTASEIVQLQGTRYAVMQEPSKGDKINEGIMKELTGGDPIQARALFKESVTFIPQFKLAVCTNTLFDIASNDEGTWRRIRVCPFMSKFKEPENIDEDDEDEPYQYEVDKKLEMKFPKWREAFLSILVEKVQETNGIVSDCDIVLSKSGEYRNSQDYLSGFVNERLEIGTDEEYVTWSELQEDFKDWYMELYGQKVPKGQELKDYMSKKFGKPVRVTEVNVKKQAWKKFKLISHHVNDTFNV